MFVLRKGTRAAHAGATLTFALAAVFSLVGCSEKNQASPAELLREARQALRASDFLTVEELVAKLPHEAEQWQTGQLLAGEAAFKDGRPLEAVDYYLRAADKDNSTQDGQLALFSAADVYLDLGQLTEAESLYRDVLELQPQNGLTNQRIAFLLSITGRRWEALDHYDVLVRGGDADYLELAIAADVTRYLDQPEFLEKCRTLAPNDEYVRLAWATRAYDKNEPEARSLLEALVTSQPELIPAQAMLGERLADVSDRDVFIEWHEALPAGADDSPGIWFARGLWAHRQSDFETAADCFKRCLTRVPYHRRASYLLGQVLVSLDDPQAAEMVAYSEQLIELTASIEKVLETKGFHEEAVRRTAEILERLGRIWETCAWGVIARQNFPQSKWPHELLDRHKHKLTDRLERIEPDKNPTVKWTLDEVPKIDGLIAKLSGGSPHPTSDPPLQESVDSRIRFEEVQLISFQYYNADDPNTKGARTFEQTGGGVAILDYDMDGTPDVFLTQGSEWRSGEHTPTASSRYRDQLFRNVAGRKFEDVTDHLFGADTGTGFGQGCAAGDFNNDGFPDLYVANVGRNCLYQNMGDGTFSNVTLEAGIDDESWTASVMICDLNADGLPDIFDVNYLEGKGVYTRICREKACSPTVFPGARDRLLINQGDGRFAMMDDATPRADSKGLGIVAFEIEPNRRPVLFIANDQVANYFLENKPADNPHNIRLDDSALINGLAFNEDGLPMACMGVAVDDWDGNNLVDLFVTNFHNEFNTLYLQKRPGVFVDGTKHAGLDRPSFLMTGWGTQSLDADLDGKPDLIVANGHVDDYREDGGEYHMQPQFFRNRGGRFQEMTPQELGPWFGRKYLGRGLARVDWNLDGLPDFIVSNMNDPVSVIKNTTIGTGRFLKFRLYATRTARDARGVRVALRMGGREIEKQLTAGDGYMASNERMLHFGLGNVAGIDEAVIRWPSGSISILKSPPLDSTYIVVENATRATCSQSTLLTSFPVVAAEKAGL